MAIDTPNKRASMLSMGRPFVPTLPVPSGGISTAAERAQLIYRYSGLLPDDTGGIGGGGSGAASWILSELGRWFLRALADYRGTPQYVEWRGSEMYRAFVRAVVAYDAGAPYPTHLQPDVAQKFLDYLIENGG